jgi:hypothetical protein
MNDRPRLSPPVPRSHDTVPDVATALAALGVRLPGLVVPRGPDAATLAALLAALPAGQRRVAEALVAEPWGRTYPEVAAALGVHAGTVHTQLRRLRASRPAVYAALMAARGDQLAARHARALSRRRARRWTRRYICWHVYGCEPWER